MHTEAYRSGVCLGYHIYQCSGKTEAIDEGCSSFWHDFSSTVFVNHFVDVSLLPMSRTGSMLVYNGYNEHDCSGSVVSSYSYNLSTCASSGGAYAEYCTSSDVVTYQPSAQPTSPTGTSPRPSMYPTSGGGVTSPMPSPSSSGASVPQPSPVPTGKLVRRVAFRLHVSILLTIMLTERNR